MVIGSVTMIRAAVWLYYHFRPYTEANKHTRVWVLFLFMIASGALWGVAAAPLFSLSTNYESVLLLLVYATLVSGTLVSLSSILPVFISYATLVITPLGIYLLSQDMPVLNTLGAGLFVFLLAHILMSLNVERAIVDMISLRDKNEILILELLEKNQLAERANSDKSEFLAAISHDLRQPLHAMGLYLNGLCPYVNKQGKEVLNKAQESAVSLRNMFNGLLDLSRLDSDAFEPDIKVIRLASLLPKIAEDFANQADEKGLVLETEILEIGVCSDPNLLERLIRNLMANAVQYSEVGRIVLRTTLDGDKVTITVQDEGRGIPENELDNIFSEYHQLKYGERDRNRGVGLGLAIVLRICTILSIPIDVESQLGQGSSFSIKLPMVKLSVVEHKEQKQSPWDLQDQFVVVIDDEQDILEGTGQLLAAWGCEVITADSGQKAITQLAEQASMPAVLVVDYRLKEETGVEVIAKIRAEYKHNIPAMIITGDTIVDLSIEARDYDLLILHKPVSPAELRTAIYQLIRPG